MKYFYDIWMLEEIPNKTSLSIISSIGKYYGKNLNENSDDD